MESILDIVPVERQKVYDVRKVIAAIADKDSLFELKPNYGKTATTAFTRIAGRSVGVIANNPMFKGGAIDPDGCNKVTSFMVLCDSFNIPIVMLVDVPGFLIGVDGERIRRAWTHYELDECPAARHGPKNLDHSTEKLRPGLSQHGRWAEQRRSGALAVRGSRVHGPACWGERRLRDYA